MQTDGKQCRPWSDCSFRISLIGVYPVRPDLSVWILRINIVTTIWAISWDYGTFCPPLTHSLNARRQPSSGARCVIFGRNLRLLPYFMYANSEGSGKTAWMRRLIWAFAGRPFDKYHNLMSWLNFYCRQNLSPLSPRSPDLRNPRRLWNPSQRERNLDTCNSQRWDIWAATWQNQQNDLCAQRRLRSVWASVQTDLSLRWAHMPFC